MQNLICGKIPNFSFEIFPPKGPGSLSSIYDTIDALATLRPDLISVTYGAGGSNRENTVEIASTIQNKYRLPAVAHVTCVGCTLEQTDSLLKELQAKGVKTVLALRGDRPKDSSSVSGYFKHASELTAYIRENYDFCVLGACYPEKHPEAPSLAEDIRHLKEKVDAGADGLITQLFLDNDDFYRFRDLTQRAGIHVPILAGIMPITQASMLEKIVSMCGAGIPRKVQRFVDAYRSNAEALREAGIAYAAEQIVDLLASGVDGVHIYSMNKADITRRITGSISGILYSLRAGKADGSDAETD